MVFAPMEGVTSCVFRSLHADCFPGADRYYAPFIAPDGSGRFRGNALRDLLPENNRVPMLIPQILCNRAEAFLSAARELAALGYEEVNLNAGCPSGTVVSKHKGAGMLADLRTLDDFLANVFSRCPIRVSVKTRLGMESVEEFPAILEIYNKYPIRELIIHARTRSGMYRSAPDIAAFAAALPRAAMPVCYNGNIVDRASLDQLRSACPSLERVMLGRGAAANPALFRILRGGETLRAEELSGFLDRLLDALLASGVQAHHALARMKELWFYLSDLFPGGERLMKALNKASSLEDYRAAVRALFASGRFDGAAAFRR